MITGAGSGVGRAIALRFAREGWTSRWSARAVALAETMALAGTGQADRLARSSCDVSEPADVATMGEAVLARSRVDVLVNSAGINVPARSFDALSLDDWHAVLATNLHGAYYCVRAFLPGMRARRTGTIVNINSDVGKVARDLAGPAYVSSKFGLSGLTQQINAEERAHGVRACSICPRDVNTPLLDKRPQPPPAEPARSMIQPDDLAAVRVAGRDAPVAGRGRGDFALDKVRNHTGVWVTRRGSCRSSSGGGCKRSESRPAPRASASTSDRAGWGASRTRPPVPPATLCGDGTLLIHTIESPTLMVMTGSMKAAASMVTVWVTGRGATAAVPEPLHDSSPGTATARSRKPRA